MQSTGDYYQRAPRCCPGRNANANADALRISASVRGAELLCCCCSCSTATSTKTPGLLASLGVCVLVLGYTLLGAFAFMALEGGLKSVGPLFDHFIFPSQLHPPGGYVNAFAIQMKLKDMLHINEIKEYKLLRIRKLLKVNFS
ncbi:hypothetical protein K0M31_017247 [Melipona bicolor]|uniref:Uncharacterized protein n=1 Tax=Melipona bicolor TaxID=60889 RepID=A0AA40G4G2_9HYME|nr:hypothetical protein K0M31_017247 [Melipona bicolor]